MMKLTTFHVSNMLTALKTVLTCGEFISGQCQTRKVGLNILENRKKNCLRFGQFISFLIAFSTILAYSESISGQF